MSSVYRALGINKDFKGRAQDLNGPDLAQKQFFA